MKGDRIFVDSNIFLYLLGNVIDKQEKAIAILAARPVVSPQVIFENINVALKKFGFSKVDALSHGQRLLDNCTLFLDNKQTVQLSLDLIQRHTLQVYDSRILASALDSGCEILFSEDFQHLRVFESRLTVINPFIS